MIFEQIRYRIRGFDYRKSFILTNTSGRSLLSLELDRLLSLELEPTFRGKQHRLLSLELEPSEMRNSLLQYF